VARVPRLNARLKRGEPEGKNRPPGSEAAATKATPQPHGETARLKGCRYEGKTFSEEGGGGDAESFAEFFDVMFVELAFAAEDLGDDAFGAEERGEIFRAEALPLNPRL